MMRGRRMADADAAAQQDGHREPAVAHVLDLGDLIDDLADGVEDEIGEHEVDDRSRAGHGGPAAEADEPALADRRVAEPSGAIEVIEPGRRLEVAAALADAFTHDEDRRVACHFFGQGLEGGLHISDLAGAVRRSERGLCRREGGAEAAFDSDESDSSKTNRVGCIGVWPGAGFGELLCVVDDGVDLGLDGLELGARHGAVLRTIEPRKPSDRAAGFPGFDLLAGAVGVVAHAFGVRPGAVGPAFEQGRALRRCERGATASPAAWWMASTSLPSTSTPGIP